ncbi:mucin-3A-like [Argopecten irradians]|uniref:mucin-3A-like n=1 Tax=Argopecten irradians TaxID=31199 RepID=UPI003716AEDD
MYKNGQCVDYRWCLYKFYNQAESWFDAQAICEAGNMTLAHITESADNNYIKSMMETMTSIGIPHSEVWMGGYRHSGNTKWLGICESVDNAYYSHDDHMEEDACLFLDSTLKANSCTSSKAFLCQVSTLEFQTCFKSTSTLHSAGRHSIQFHVSDTSECFYQCTGDCLGIKITTQTQTSTYVCDQFTYTSTKPYSKRTELPKYVKDIIRTTNSNDITASRSNLQNICPTSVRSVKVQTTQDITPSTPSSIAPSTTAGVTLTMTASTVTPFHSSTIEPSFTEPSNTEFVTGPGTASQSTPPLSIDVTSVDLTKTSLPTVSETLSLSCSSCPCIKSTSVNEAEMENSISKLKEQLKVDPKKLSSFKRKLTSAPDDRQSAANIGYGGVLILCVIPTVIILMDVGRLTREFKQFISRIRNSQRATATVIPLRET